MGQLRTESNVRGGAQPLQRPQQHWKVTRDAVTQDRHWPGDPVLYCSRAVEVRGKAASYLGPRSSGGARGQNDICCFFLVHFWHTRMIFGRFQYFWNRCYIWYSSDDVLSCVQSCGQVLGTPTENADVDTLRFSLTGFSSDMLNSNQSNTLQRTIVKKWTK